MSMQMEDLIRHFLTRAAPMAAGFVGGQMEGAELRRKRGIEDTERTRAETERLQAEEDRRRRIERETAADTRAMADQAAQDATRAREAANPFVYQGNRFPTEDAMREFIRRNATTTAEVTAAHRAPSSDGESTKRSSDRAAAEGMARTLYAAPRGATAAGVRQRLRAAFPNLPEGEIQNIALEAGVWVNQQKDEDRIPAAGGGRTGSTNVPNFPPRTRRIGGR